MQAKCGESAVEIGPLNLEAYKIFEKETFDASVPVPRLETRQVISNKFR